MYPTMASSWLLWAISVCLTVFHVTAAKSRPEEVYMVALPRALVKSSTYDIFVKGGTKDVVFSITSFSDRLKHDSAPVILRGGKGSVKYRIPFQDFKGTSLTLNVSLTELRLTDYEETAGNVLFQRQVKLSVFKNTKLIFVQTSSIIYRPKGKVAFRLFAMDPNSLKHITSRFDLIYIKSPSKVRKVQWRNVNWKIALKGLYFPLESDAEKGVWTIKAVMGDEQEFVFFQVDDTPLASFYVTVDVPKYLYVMDLKKTQIATTTWARYYNGLPVKGNFEIKVCVVNFNTPAKEIEKAKKPICITSERSFNTKGYFAYIIKKESLELRKRFRRYNEGQLYVKAVVEDHTGEKVVQEVWGPKITLEAFKLVYEGPSYYSPGLPYYGRVKALYHDGTPMSNLELIADSFFHYEGKGVRADFKTNAEGIVDFTVPPNALKPISMIGSLYSKNLPYVSKKRLGEALTPHVRVAMSAVESPTKTYMQFYPLHRMPPQNPCKSGKLNVMLQANVPLHDKTIYVLISSRTGLQSTQTFKPSSRAKPLCKATDKDDFGHYVCVPSISPGESPKIRCLEGWTGTNCLTPVCIGGCNNGVCIRPGECACQKGWTGPACSDCVPREGCVSGCCVAGDDCNCYKGYTGYYCDKESTINQKTPSCGEGMIEIDSNSTGSSEFKLKEEIEEIEEIAEIPYSLEEMRLFTRNLTIDFTVNVYPSADVVAWFVYEDEKKRKELVTSKLTIADLKECLEVRTPTSFKFVDQTVNPGQTTSAIVSTSGSNVTCCLTISNVALLDLAGVTPQMQREDSEFRLSFLLNRLKEKVSGDSLSLVEDPYRQLKHQPCNKRKLRELIRGARSGSRSFPAALIADASVYFKSSGIFMATNVPLSSCQAEEASPLKINYLSAGKKDESKWKTAKKELNEIVRSFFPEVWRFDLLEDPTIVSLTAPESITTWNAKMFCLSSEGLGIAKPTYLNVTMPISIRFVLPASIEHGDDVRIPVTVYNFLDSCRFVELQWTPTRFYEKALRQRLQVCLCKHDGATMFVSAKPKAMGEVAFIVTAVSNYECEKGSREGRGRRAKKVMDRMRRQLVVKPPGYPKLWSYGDILCPTSLSDEKMVTVNLAPPSPLKERGYVKGSTRGFVSWSGSILGSAMNDIDRWFVNLQHPWYTNAWDYSLTAAKNAYILQFLINKGMSESTLARKARSALNTDCRLLLNALRSDGAFNVHGIGGFTSKSSSLVTAFAVNALAAASRYVNVSNEQLTSVIRYLKNNTLKSGCFLFDERAAESTGHFPKALNEMDAAAFILSSLVEATTSKPSLKNETADVIKSAEKCLSKVWKDRQLPRSTFSLALMAYALSAVKPNLDSYFQQQLSRRATVRKGFRYWRVRREQDGKPTLTLDVTTTAYALLAGVRKAKSSKDVANLLPITRWLINRRNYHGLWRNDFDTMLAVKALTAIGNVYPKLSAVKIRLTVTMINEKRFSANKRAKELIKLTALLHKKNNLVFNRKSAPVPTRVTFKASGIGCVVIESGIVYTVNPRNRSSPFINVSHQVLQRVGACNKARIMYCVEYAGEKDLEEKDASTLIPITIKALLSSGWSVFKYGYVSKGNSSRKSIITSKGVGQPKPNELTLQIYVAKSKKTCINIEIKRKFSMKSPRPTFIRAFHSNYPDRAKSVRLQVPNARCVKYTNVKCPVCFDWSDYENIKKKLEFGKYAFGVAKKKGNNAFWKLEVKGTDEGPYNATFKLPKGCWCVLERFMLTGFDNSDSYRSFFTSNKEHVLDGRWIMINMISLNSRPEEARAIYTIVDNVVKKKKFQNRRVKKFE